MSAEKLTRNDITRLLDINDLLYTRTAPTNPVVERTQKKSFAEGGSGTTYTSNDHLIVNLQTGTDFIDPQQSFLVFDVVVAGTATHKAHIVGSAVNFIRDSQVSTRSGREMDRTEDLNLLQYHLLRKEPTTYLNENANGLMFANYHNTQVSNEGQSRAPLTVGTTERLMIPLKYLGGIFDTHKLMPPHLARGLRIDLTLEAFATALVGLDDSLATVTGYTISKPYILADSYRMDDSVLEYLNAEFASRETGLVYEYFSWHTTKSTTSTGEMNVEVRRSVSMALDVFATTRDNVNKNTLNDDSFASYPIDPADKSQWRIGSHYLPNTQIEGVVEHYAQYLYWGNKLRGEMADGSNFTQFQGSSAGGGADTSKFGVGKFCATLERNNVLSLSGIAINNSMTLAVDATLADPSPTRNINVFLRHLRRAVLFLENVKLEV